MEPLNHFYSIIDYTATGADNQPEIAAEFARIQEDWVARYPGFLWARFLASTDGGQPPVDERHAPDLPGDRRSRTTSGDLAYRDRCKTKEQASLFVGCDDGPRAHNTLT